MNGREAIESSDQIHSLFQYHLEQLAEAITDARRKWDRLGKVGGQRDDAAAEYLKPIRDCMRALAAESDDCLKKLNATITNPFGDS